MVENLIHLIMFDVDGTLVDSTRFDEECFLKTAEILFGTEISSDWDSYEYATDIGILSEAILRYEIPGDEIILVKKFRKIFLELISKYISSNPGCIREIKGAADFIRELTGRNNCRVAIATGGWEEAAKYKLEAAGIDIAGCAFASSSDHFSREGIMRKAESMAYGGVPFESKIYFGDALWDKKACENMNYRFILVGDRFEHKESVQDYSDKEILIEILGI
jgi:phosphoglycolate phosphatase-like HAD superfamily hydrolase